LRTTAAIFGRRRKTKNGRNRWKTKKKWMMKMEEDDDERMWRLRRRGRLAGSFNPICGQKRPTLLSMYSSNSKTADMRWAGRKCELKDAKSADSQQFYSLKNFSLKIHWSRRRQAPTVAIVWRQSRQCTTNINGKCIKRSREMATAENSKTADVRISWFLQFDHWSVRSADLISQISRFDQSEQQIW
jgi:hypothetical protein